MRTTNRAGSIRCAGPAALLVVAGMLSACAGGSEVASGSRAAAAARGQALAEQSCGRCHGLGVDGVSRFPTAPAFRDMRVNYNAVRYARRMAQMHLGRTDMPPAELSQQQIDDIGAYVRSLRRSGKARRGARPG